MKFVPKFIVVALLGMALVLGATAIFPPLAHKALTASQSFASRFAGFAHENAEEDYRDEDRNRGNKPDEALKFRLMQMQDEAKRIPADGLLKAKDQLRRMRAEQTKRAKAAGKPQGMTVANLDPSDWVWLGPGNVGGRIRAIAIDPNNPNRLWVGSVAGGLWHSADGGNLWAPVNDFLANLAISSLVIDPTNPTIMYAGTGEFFATATRQGEPISPDGLRGLGVFKSTDGGATWAQLPATNPADPAVCAVGTGCAWSYVNRLAVSPDGATLLAATWGGVWRSTNGGTSWTQGANTAGLVIGDVDFDPANSQRCIASGNSMAMSSTDRGQTWTAATPALTGRVEVAYAPSSSNIVYASVNGNQGEIFRSSDGGQTYVRVNTGQNYLSNQGGYGNIIWVNPQDPNMVIVGGIDLWRSTNAGANLTQISAWQCGPGQHTECAGTSAHADHHMIVAAPGFNNTTNKTVYFANDGGIFRTDDVASLAQSSGWINLNHNLGITQFYSGTASRGGVLLGGTQDNGNLRADPDGNFSPPYDPQGWNTPLGATGDGGYVASDFDDPGYLYVEYTNLQISRSSDGGEHFSPIYCNPSNITPVTRVCTSPTGIADAANGANFIAPFILDPTNADRMLAGGVSLWRSNNVKSASVPTWSAIKSPAAPLPPAPGATPNPTPPISAIVVSTLDENIVAVGHNDGQIYLSQNGALAVPGWNRIDSATLPKRFVSRLAIDPSHAPAWIYATFGGFSADNIYVTKDLGATWTDITGSGATALPNVPVRSLLVSVANPRLLYVGTEIGIFVSEDAGETWQLPQGGPANVSVDDLFWQNGTLVAATHGRGMYIANGGGGGGGGGGGIPCGYPLPTCPEGFNCTPGDWYCPCTWNNGRVPTSQDDVALPCGTITVRGHAQVRNLLVGDGTTLIFDGGGLSVPNGTVTNYGNITGATHIQTDDLLNGGQISAGTIQANGDLINGGTVEVSGAAPTDSSVFNGIGYPVRVGKNLYLTGLLTAQAVACLGDLQVGESASLVTLSTDYSRAPALMLFQDVYNNGLLDNRGELGFPAFGTHLFSGTGSWQTGMLNLGMRQEVNGSGITISLGNDIAMEISGFNAIQGAAVFVSANSNIKLNGHSLSLTTPMVLSFGQWDFAGGTLHLQNASLDIRDFGRNSSLGPPGFIGNGTVNWAASGAATLFFQGRHTPSLHLLSGTVNASDLRMNIDGSFTIDPGATFNFNQGSLTLLGDLILHGAIGKTTPLSSGATLTFFGSTLTNNGTLAGDFLQMNYGIGAAPRTQTITGSGTWPSGRNLRVGFPNVATTVNLANDVTISWSAFEIWQGSSINTGAFTLTMPGSMAFNDIPHSDGRSLSGEITGKVRRTNIAGAGGPVAFNHPFTSLQFTSGTPPTEVTMTKNSGAPADLTNAVQRRYDITPVGGNNYAATLRLSYIDSEMNGNNENALALWRNQGSGWTSQGTTARNVTANWVELSGVTAFSSWALASCSLSISPEESDLIPAAGGAGAFFVQSTGGCDWTALSDAAWISIVSGSSGTGPGEVNYSVAANSGESRSGTINVTGSGVTRTYYVTQAADCGNFTIDPTSRQMAYYSEAGQVMVTATSSSCPWGAVSNVDWLVIYSGAHGTGNGTVYYYGNYNFGPERTGTMTIAGQTFTVTQESGCSYYLTPTEGGHPGSGGMGTFNISTADGCDWTAVSTDDWITITSSPTGAGAADIQYSVAAHSGAPRTGFITLGGQTFTVRQGSPTPMNLVVTNTDNSGPGSLRDAMELANNNVGHTNTIRFNLNGPVTIAPDWALPAITNPLILEGINADGRRVVLDGRYHDLGNGLDVPASNCIIRGLVIVRWNTGLASFGDYNAVENCYVGTDETGAPGLGNSIYGIIAGGNQLRLGGPSPALGNVIAQNSYIGVIGGGYGHVIQNNHIGTNPAGANLGNAWYGVYLSNVYDNLVADNAIAFNQYAGLTLYYGSGNKLQRNRVWNNANINIDLGDDGLTPNDSDDTDEGTNYLQNFPELTTSAGADTIQGTLQSAPNAAFEIEMFMSNDCTEVSFGSGQSYRVSSAQTFLGKVAVTTDHNGAAAFTFPLPSSVTTGRYITATATDAAGNTSELSACLQVTPLRITSIALLADGHVLIKGAGVPNQTHTLQLWPDFSGSTPTTISVSTDDNGLWQYEDAVEPPWLPPVNCYGNQQRMKFYSLAYP